MCGGSSRRRWPISAAASTVESARTVEARWAGRGQSGRRDWSAPGEIAVAASTQLGALVKESPAQLERVARVRELAARLETWIAEQRRLIAAGRQAGRVRARRQRTGAGAARAHRRGDDRLPRRGRAGSIASAAQRLRNANQRAILTTSIGGHRQRALRRADALDLHAQHQLAPARRDRQRRAPRRRRAARAAARRQRRNRAARSRHPSDRDRARRRRGARTPARQRTRRARRERTREPAEGRIPRHALARAAHAAQRDPRLVAAAARARRTIRRRSRKACRPSSATRARRRRSSKTCSR